MATQPADILHAAITRAMESDEQSLIENPVYLAKLDLISRDVRNRACVRFVLACALAKVHRPDLDIRQPYTEIRSAECYSGRTYDERYITRLITQYRLPCNATTAFLTPAFRNRNITLTPETVMVGRPESLYRATLQVLTDIQAGEVSASDVLSETLRRLLIIRDEQEERLRTLLAGLSPRDETTQLSAEQIVMLVALHLASRHSSRLPVLIVAAAYQIMAGALQIEVRPLHSHNAADEQTGALGDVEIIDRQSEDAQAPQLSPMIRTIYEIKARAVQREDIEGALRKIAQSPNRVQQYLFVTTVPITPDVREFAATQYEETGIEIALLDCLQFLRHVLHLFYPQRGNFLETYQAMLLAEPESAVSNALKEAFLALRQAAESD